VRREAGGGPVPSGLGPSPFTAERPDLTGLRILVTGSTSGIGRAMAAALLESGGDVAVTGRSAERARRVAREIAREPADRERAMGLSLDVTDEASIDGAVGALEAAWGGLDVLVNNAGLGMRHVNPRFFDDPRPFWEVTPTGFAEVVATNLAGYFLVARAVVPAMVERGRGRIVNVTMNHETMVRRGFVPYGPARAGAEALSRIMERDLEGTGVTVNLLLPGGATDTGMIPDELVGARREGLLPPSVMAAPIRWLCSAASDGMSGLRIVAKDFTWPDGRSVEPG